MTLGATYQSKTKMSKFSKYAGLFADQGNFDIPANYGVGIAVKAAPETTVAFDVEQIQYADVPSVGNTFSSCRRRWELTMARASAGRTSLSTSSA